MDLLTAVTSNPAALGILYDGVGIFILGVPAMLSTAADITRASGSIVGYNSELIRATVLVRLDTGTGSLFLIAGFLLQFFGAIGVVIAPLAGMLLATSLVVLTLLYWLLFRAKFADRWVQAVVSNIEKKIAAQRAQRKPA